MPYGTVEGVAALSRIWTQNGVYSDPDAYGEGTNPTRTTVEHWLAQVSAAVDAAMANQGFKVPIQNNELAENAVGMVVEAFVADLAHAANSSGRFFTDHAIERGTAPINVIVREINAWVDEKTTGLELMGVSRIENKAGKNEAVFDVI